MIQLDDVRLTLSSGGGEVEILCGINLVIERGETVGVVGPSGSGKTSMLMVMAGLEAVSGGSIRAAGLDLRTLDEDGLARYRRDHVGIVFQNFYLVPTLTALENVAIPLEFAGRAAAIERAAGQLDAVGLGHRLGHYPGQLSGGEKQRVALARAFVTTPEILLADEPTGSLDGATSERVMDILFAQQERHATTMILVTHEPSLAARCSRRLELVDGRIVSVGQANDD